MTVKGELAPDAVNPPGELVTVNDVAAAPVAEGVKVTLADPLLYALPDPTLVAVPIVGATGADLAPDALDPIIGMCSFYLTSVLLIVDLAHT